MCVAIVKKPTGVLSDAVLEACFSSNKDGAGFAYVEDDKVVVDKGYMTFQSFLTAYRAAEAKMGDTTPFLVHFRISTGGTVSADNCHPFATPHGALIHNGYLFYVNGEKSDTNKFAERFGDRLTTEGVLLHKKAIETSLGTGNKVALLYPDKTYQIINEDAGSWIDDVWFSNCYWKPRTTVVGFTGTANPRAGVGRDV